MKEHPEFDLEPCDRSIYAAHKVQECEKNISFTTMHYEPKSSDRSNYIHKTKVTFKKICAKNDDHIEVFVQKFTKKTRPKRCDLGHYHDSEEYEWDEWQRLNLAFEDFGRLIEWYQNGRFYDPRTQQAKKANAKNGLHSTERLK